MSLTAMQLLLHREIEVEHEINKIQRVAKQLPSLTNYHIASTKVQYYTTQHRVYFCWLDKSS